MSAVQIAGCSGAGKTAIAAMLAERGLAAIDSDSDPLLARLDARHDNNWGCTGDTRAYLRRKLPELQDRLRAAGAIPIDARQPLDQVVDEILHTLAGS
jgi:predicted ATPase